MRGRLALLFLIAAACCGPKNEIRRPAHWAETGEREAIAFIQRCYSEKETTLKQCVCIMWNTLDRYGPSDFETLRDRRDEAFYREMVRIWETCYEPGQVPVEGPVGL